MARLDEIARAEALFPLTPGRFGRPGAPHWVDPVLVGDIEYREYTGEGLRHPSWRGLRTDKTPGRGGDARVMMDPRFAIGPVSAAVSRKFRHHGVSRYILWV
ncbi:hypothetical protein [Nocardia sp. NPDC002869]|uniref:ATP dependent DNA ligase n=1 Tax=Nocardia sp. NPDC002869 TaxID=3161032 RepID=UPI00398D163B